MHISTIIALLAVGISAAPSNPSTNIERRTPEANSRPSHVRKCDELENCESYTDEKTGKFKIRFKRDMGPGSAYYEERFSKMKRDDEEVKTQVSIQDEQVNWGCNTNCQDAVAGIIDLCPPGSGTCKTTEGSEASVGIQRVDEPHAVIKDDTLTITAEGEYPIWAEQAFVSGVKALAGAGPAITKDIPFLSATPGTKGIPIFETSGHIPDHCDQVKQSTSFDIQRHVGPAMQGFIHVNVQSESDMKEGGLCGTWKGVTEIGTAFLGLLPGIGPGIAAVFGTVTSTCDL